MILRPYQQAMVDAIIRAARGGQNLILAQSPTGTGKTEVFSALAKIAKFPLVIAPELAPMEQARERLELRLGERCDVEQGSRYVDPVAGALTGGRPRVVVASKDSLLSRERYKVPALDRTTLVIVDECHIGTTPAFERVLRWYMDRGATVVGFSATPYKGRGKPLRFWPRPTFAFSLREALQEEWLAHPMVYLSEAKSYDLRAVEMVAGDWHQGQLEAVLVAEHAAQEVRALVMQTYKRRPSVVYAHSVTHAKLLHDVLTRTGASVAIVHSQQSDTVRQDNIKAFVSGEAHIIVNVGILGMGWDHPPLTNIYLAAPSRSLARLEQRIGRGTRLLPGVLQPGMTLEERRAARLASDKPTFNVYDITATVSHHQLASVFDILDHKCRTSKVRRERMVGSETAGGVDAMQEIAKADAEELLAQEKAAEELRAKRRQLVVGVTFDHRSHDIFADPTHERRRGWRMLWGPHKGTPIADLPTDYLQWVVRSQKKQTPFVGGVQREIARRNGVRV